MITALLGIMSFSLCLGCCLCGVSHSPPPVDNDRNVGLSSEAFNCPFLYNCFADLLQDMMDYLSFMWIAAVCMSGYALGHCLAVDDF